MSKKWLESVRSSGQLTVFNGGSGGGAWASVFGKSLDEFNRLRKKYSLPVKMKKATSEKEAQVVVKVSEGEVEFSYDHTDYKLSFDHTRMHGKTRLLSRHDDPHIEKAYCFLPSNPQISTAKGMRPAGINILVFIAVHELIHACGLENSNHSTDTGVFYSNPSAMPGDRPAQDKVKVVKKTGKMKLETTVMPPLFLDTRTVSTLKELWKKTKK